MYNLTSRKNKHMGSVKYFLREALHNETWMPRFCWGCTSCLLDPAQVPTTAAPAGRPTPPRGRGSREQPEESLLKANLMSGE